MIASLPARDRALLNAALRLVPAADREDWKRTWLGELWHRSHPREHVTCSAIDLYPGLLRDALWLRGESYRRVLSGTALLCCMALVMSVLLTITPLLFILGGLRELLHFFVNYALRFICETGLVTFVGFATSAQHIEQSTRTCFATQARASIFQTTKITLVLLIALLLSNDVTVFFHTTHPLVAEILQSQFFVLLALIGMRWSFSDSETRCKHCLRALATPTRVGRPSWNFIDTNGTELICEAGHGFLSIPEIETSWCQSSRWIVAELFEESQE